MKQTKLHYLLLVIALTLMSCGEQQLPNFSQVWDLDDFDRFFLMSDTKVNGNVKSFTETMYDVLVESEPSAENLMFTFNRKYDEVGNMIEELKYDGNGELEMAVYMQYDKLGNVTELKQDDGNYLTTIKFEYDNKGIINRRTVYENDVEDAVIHYSYNEKRRVLLSEIYSDDGEMYGTISFEFDGNGNLMGYESKQADGEYGERVEFEFDKDGLLRMMNVLDYDMAISMAYDDEGNMKEIWENENSEAVMEYEYDEKGNWVKRSYIEEGDILVSVGERTYEYY